MEIQYTYQNKLAPLLINTVAIASLSLAAMFFSLDRLLDGDYLVAPFYIAGSVVGKWFAMNHFENVRYKLSELIKKDE